MPFGLFIGFGPVLLFVMLFRYCCGQYLLAYMDILQLFLIIVNLILEKYFILV